MTPLAAVRFSAPGSAISVAAGRLGLPDPVAIEQELTEVDAGGLLDWFRSAESVAQALFAGGARFDDVLGALTSGWSSPAPRVVLIRQQEAARACGQIIRGQLAAAEAACAVLRQTRRQAMGRVDQAQAALVAAGWPGTADLLVWAAVTGQLPGVTAELTRASEDLGALRHRNEAALSELAGALRSDPREPLDILIPARPAHRTGYPDMGDPLVGSALPAVGGSAVDAVADANAQRLAADLHSTDGATVLMALGVTGALARAREHGAVAQLVVYESANSTNQGRAAISVGDLATADNVAIVVPGVTNAPAAMADGLSDAAALVRESQRQAPTDSTAVVAWYGYDIPLSSVSGVPVTALAALGNAASAVDDANARSGGAALLADLAGFRELAPATSRWVAVGFSMGSTTVSAAAARGRGLDDLVLLGSPGAGRDVTTAGDYRAVTPEHTFVTAFDQDPVTRGETDLLAALVGTAVRFLPQSSPYGPDPATRSFGAQVVDVPSNEPEVEVHLNPGLLGPLGGLDSAVTNEIMDLAAHHHQSNYLSGPSLQAVASVVVGHYADVPTKPGR